MGRIRILPDVIANKIAAGEVVERPASVVKETLENALDAGGTRIRIEVESGGKRLIRIADDGIGMGRDDAMLAFERHATSKLRNVNDLLSISTLGFRGEALPSIASVSRLLLETRSDDEPTGTKIEIAGGRMLSVEEAALPRGTSITIRDLFYNVPARRKFLRTEQTELAHIASLATHYSLAHIDKSFHLSNEKSDLLHVTPVKTLRERVYQVFGRDTLDTLVELEGQERSLEVAGSPVVPSQAVRAAREERTATERHSFRVDGFVSQPQVQKLNRNSIYIFVNGRLIRDRLLLHAISSAYYNLIPPGNYPFALIFLEMPYEEVDVNVHPSKTEVRFRHQNFVHDFLRDSIRERLIASKPVPTFSIPASDHAPEQRRSQPGVAVPYSEASLLLSRDDLPAGDFGLRPEPPLPRKLEFGEPTARERSAEETEFREAGVAAGAGSDDNLAGAGGLGDVPFAVVEQITATADGLTVDDRPHSRSALVDQLPDTLASLGHLRPLGQLNNSFIVAVSSDGLWIIDQHVAHERILFEKVLAQRAAGRVEAQQLLMPIILTLTPSQEIRFAEIGLEFRSNGFDIEPFGHRTVAVKSAPAALSPQQVEALTHEILDTPEKEFRSLTLDDLQRRIAATIACHAAIKINMPLDGTKMHWLMDALSKTDCPMSCPHGRPIALKYALRDILKAFHRI